MKLMLTAFCCRLAFLRIDASIIRHKVNPPAVLTLFELGFPSGHKQCSVPSQ